MNNRSQLHDSLSDSHQYGTEIHFNESFKSRLDQNTHLYLIADFAKCEKGEQIQTFGYSYLGNGWGKFLQIFCVDFPNWQELLVQI